MGTQKELMLRNGQLWRISTDPGPPPGKDRWGACVLASVTDMSFSDADLAARAAVEGRCPAIAVIGPNAEAVHDYIDEIVESKGASDVLTTFNSGANGLEEALSMLDAGLSGRGPIYAFSNPPSFVENGLRNMGFIAGEKP